MPRDVIVIGAGHNGLVAAALLAKAGRRVLVVERSEQVGGCAITSEIAPGFRGPAVAHTAGPVHTALQLGAPTSIECVSQLSPSKYTFPVRGVVRLDFPARGGMPAVKVFFHDSARAGDPDRVRLTLPLPASEYRGARPADAPWTRP